MNPHGFQTNEKFASYLQCLNNIKQTSVIRYSLNNHVEGINQRYCTVAAIWNDKVGYGGGLYIGRVIILKSFESQFDGYSLNSWLSSYQQKIIAALGDRASEYNYRIVDSTFLVTKIDNRPPNHKTPAAQKFRPLKPSLNYTIEYH